MFYFLLLTFAVLPSLIWLFYYLEKDIDPEPKRLIAYVFLVGGLFAIAGYLFQIISHSIILPFVGFSYAYYIFHTFFVVGFSEELFKYLAFFFAIKSHPALDEPIDFVIYIITAALGFAALENIIYLSSMTESTLEMARLSSIRFVSGTFLHALASGILGVFLAYACNLNKKTLIFYGLILVSFLHGIYNLFAAKMNETIYMLLTFALLFFCALILSFFIRKIKKMKATCLVS